MSMLFLNNAIVMMMLLLVILPAVLSIDGFTLKPFHSQTILSEEELNSAVNIIKTHLEKLQPFGVLSSRGIQIDENGNTITNPYRKPATTSDGDLGATPSIPDGLNLQPKTGMSETCSNKLCLFYEYALSCKALGFNLKKICAQYFMGRILGCPIFPPAEDIVNAPYICGKELAQVASGLVGGISSGSGTISSYLAGNFSENCQRRCYQNYLVAANDFYENCAANLTVSPQNTTYKVAVQLKNFQTLKQQICSTNEIGQNCFSSLYQLTTAGGGTIDLFNQYCNYFGDASFNSMLLSGACGVLKSFGCCYQNQISMVNQAQTNASDLQLFPPCFLNYMSTACAGLSNTLMCSKGTNGNATIVAGTVDITRNAGTTKESLPNMYDQDSVLLLQGILIGSLTNAGLTNEQLASLGLNALQPLNVEIVKYVYYNSSGIATPASGLPPTLNGGEYATAVRGVFDFQFVVIGKDKNAAQTVYNAITQNLVGYTIAIKTQFSTSPLNSATVRVTMDTSQNGPYSYTSDPFVLPPKPESNSAQRIVSSSLLLIGSIVACISVMLA